MPDAMETIFQSALALGIHGAVSIFLYPFLLENAIFLFLKYTYHMWQFFGKIY